MDELQRLLSQWTANFADVLPLGYAFGAGMISAVNPCGFAMLPAYLGLFLGSRDLVADPGNVAFVRAPARVIAAQMGRAILVALVVTGGFVLLFGGVGIVWSLGGQLISRLVPWIALCIGMALVLLGVAMLMGRRPSANFAAVMASRLGNPGIVSVRGFFVFGLAYATASLSCTLPIFLTVVGGSLAVSGFAPAALQFVSYALGMGLIILILTVGIAVFKGAAVGGLRRVLPYVERVSALLLVIAGSYIVFYWLFKGDLIDKLS